MTSKYKYFVTVFKWISQVSLLYLSMYILFIYDNFLPLLPAF